jgi:hypothetical protein
MSDARYLEEAKLDCIAISETQTKIDVTPIF